MEGKVEQTVPRGHVGAPAGHAMGMSREKWNTWLAGGGGEGGTFAAEEWL